MTYAWRGKLFSREQYFPLVSNYLIQYFSPIFGFSLSLLVWLLVPYLNGFISFELGVFFLSCTRLGVYTVIIAGWSSNFRYSLLGALRALAQTISYKVRLVFILFILLFWFVDVIWLTFIFFRFICGQFFFLLLCHFVI